MNFKNQKWTTIFTVPFSLNLSGVCRSSGVKYPKIDWIFKSLNSISPSIVVMTQTWMCTNQSTQHCENGRKTHDCFSCTSASSRIFEYWMFSPWPFERNKALLCALYTHYSNPLLNCTCDVCCCASKKLYNPGTRFTPMLSQFKCWHLLCFAVGELLLFISLNAFLANNPPLPNCDLSAITNTARKSDTRARVARTCSTTKTSQWVDVSSIKLQDWDSAFVFHNFSSSLTAALLSELLSLTDSSSSLSFVRW